MSALNLAIRFRGSLLLSAWAVAAAGQARLAVIGAIVIVDNTILMLAPNQALPPSRFTE